MINNDCVQSESQVSQIAAARRQQVNTYFSGARQGLSQFFIGSVIAVQTFIAGKQAEIIAAVARALAGADRDHGRHAGSAGAERPDTDAHQSDTGKHH